MFGAGKARAMACPMALMRAAGMMLPVKGCRVFGSRMRTGVA